MKISIHQPQYIPWPGYFAKILSSDRFVFLENAQYQKNSIINRNTIMISGKAAHLTIPVKKSPLDTPIGRKEVLDNKWRIKHIKSIDNNYKKYPFHEQLMELMAESLEIKSNSLSEIAIRNVELICRYLGIGTTLTKEEQLPEFKVDSPTDRLVKIVRFLDGDEYICGTGGKNYMDETLFAKNGINLRYMAYRQTPYVQHNSKEFVEGLSILDMIANMAPSEINDHLRKNWVHYE
ncbi:WbqC family protein [Maridesulfovibrio sp.]|uniref:WbqC family protein n=1 Tax=Maridesulfovibrio sp. TaxID=2795000 RepID=UPI002A1897FC|nr:WbqC family protein [Maridesulfovibrio sp.]